MGIGHELGPLLFGLESYDTKATRLGAALITFCEQAALRDSGHRGT
jgi:hypothetical protein